jgi:hypothetical protein
VKILRGGSAEIRPNTWFKFDIELDESDLQALIVKHNLDGSKLTVIQKYKLLVNQAELLTTVEMQKQGMEGDKTPGSILSEFNDLVETLPKAG